MIEKKKKDKLLTTRFDAQTMAEFSAAVELLGARSINALVHQMIYQKIAEAKALVSRDEFAALVENRKAETAVRSVKYQRASPSNNEASPSDSEPEIRLEFIGELAPKSKNKLPMIETVVETREKKKTG